MRRYKRCIRVSLFLLLTSCVLLAPAYAHYPHDIHSFVSLSPDYANDSTAIIASKQASSTRPVTALISRNAGASWEFNARGMDNINKISSATASPLFVTDKTIILTTEGEGVYRTVDAGVSWQKYNQGLSDLDLHSSAAT
ncbi:MAG TPA: hypothetical protein ENJ64_05920, partial [Thiotrichales bacterium]|nr:hypothetical protein [Thiotrichales bacterium]